MTKKTLIAVTCMLAATVAPLAVAQSFTTRLAAAKTPMGAPPRELRDGTAKLTGHFDPNQMLRLVFALQPPHMADEQQFLSELQDRTSPQFHRFLTAEEWNTRFSPSAEDERAVLDWATSQGLTITNRYPNRLLVDLEAPAGTIEKALQVTLNRYQLDDGYSYFSNDRAPVIPAGLGRIVGWVGGLNNIQHMHPASLGGKVPPGSVYRPGPVVAKGESMLAAGDRGKLPQAPMRNGTAPLITNGSYDPSDLYSSQAYNYAALHGQGHCCNPLGNSAGSPPNSSIALAAYGAVADSDVVGFQNQYPYLAIHYQIWVIDGGPDSCSGNSAQCPANFETTLDTEWSIATSNSLGSPVDTATVYVYECDNLLSDVPDVYNTMLSQGFARIASTSFDSAESDWGAAVAPLFEIFTSMAGQGWTLVAAAGDQGATADCQTISVNYPASDPNFVAVGGTSLLLSSSGTYDSEVAWGGLDAPGSCAGNTGGGGGGCSADFYFEGTNPQGATACGTYRSMPDIALNAWGHGQNIYFNGGPQAGVIGTSIAAPELAGFFAQEGAYLDYLGSVTGNSCGVLHVPCSPMGSGNQYLYYAGLNPTSVAHYPFYDITTGCNSNDITDANPALIPYCAGPGYDQVTGWGSANMLQLAWAINSNIAGDAGAPSVAWTGPPTGAWYNSNQLITWIVEDTALGGAVPNGVAGFSQAWDLDPGDESSEPTPGAGNSFYSGPQFPNGTTGNLTLSNSLGQGCHTVNVRAWDNAGVTQNNGYGPLCFDNIAPQTTAGLSGTLVSGTIYAGPVVVTLTATDSGSGVAHTYYGINGGPVQTYTGPFSVGTIGSDAVTFHSVDIAGNVEGKETTDFTVLPTTVTTLATSANPSNYGQALTLTATVTASNGSTPVGTATFYNGTTVIGTVGLNGRGVATLPYAFHAGSWDLTAKYNGAVDMFPASASIPVLQVVNPLSTTTGLVSTLNPANAGLTVTFIATVTTSSGKIATGSVEFLNGATSLGAYGLNASGFVELNDASLSIGTHSITAKFLGGADYSTSTSAAVSQVVNAIMTTTTLTASPNPSTVGQFVMLTATATAANGATPTGNVTFYNGATSIGTKPLSGGVAILNTIQLPAGTDNLTATYGGSTTMGVSTSAPVAQVVSQVATTTTLTTSPNPSSAGQSVTMTATIGYTGSTIPSGTVTFYSGGSAIGSGTVSFTGAAVAAVLKYSGLPVGTDSITAIYGGTASFSGSTAAAVLQVVNAATTATTLTAAPNPSSGGQTVTFTATVSASGSVNPTGTVSFYNGSVAIGNIGVSAGLAKLNDSALTAGTHSITATYNGSATLPASTSAALTQTVNAEPTSTTLVSSPNPSTTGQVVTLTATVAATNGATPAGTVSFEDGATLIANVSLSSGVAVLNHGFTTPGTHSLTAKYTGSSEFAASTSNSVKQVVDVGTTTMLTTAPNPSNSGQSVAMTAMVTSSSGGTPTGMVTFYNGADSIGTGTLNGTGEATLNYSGLTVGTDIITAAYGGAGSFAGSTSSPVSQVVKVQYTESVLYSFVCSSSSCTDAQQPNAGLIFDAHGNLYGTTGYGGSVGSGAVFELSPPSGGTGPWSETVLYNFTGGTGVGNDGSNPDAGLIFDSHGNLYGTTTSGGVSGFGTAFELSPPSGGSGPWAENILYNFTGGSDGGNIYAGLIFDANGNLYGVAATGGIVADCFGLGCGVVFELTPPSGGSGFWTETPLYSFTGGIDGGNPGDNPAGSLIFDSHGNLYGTTYKGGNLTACPGGGGNLPGCGVGFELSPPSGSSGPWTETVLYNFTGGNDGSEPSLNLTFDSHGNLYGATTAGGTGSTGVVFELSPPSGGSGPWTETTLYTLTGGADETGVIFDANGNLYGTTYGSTGGAGVAFELTPPSGGSGLWTETLLHPFTDGADGGYPWAGVIFDSQGNLYGTTFDGGAYGVGVVFELIH